MGGWSSNRVFDALAVETLRCPGDSYLNVAVERDVEVSAAREFDLSRAGTAPVADAEGAEGQGVFAVGVTRRSLRGSRWLSMRAARAQFSEVSPSGWSLTTATCPCILISV